MTNDGWAAFPEKAELLFHAYYYSFRPTGCYEIDLILAAVAAAGKAFHNTESWHEELGSDWRPGMVGETPINWIQNAANHAAAMLADDAAHEKEEQ
jgi:hypothetical protein